MSEVQARKFDCVQYVALPGSVRCRHYRPDGACELPDEFMCVEWLKRNAPAPLAPPPTRPPDPPVEPADLFGRRRAPRTPAPAPKTSSAPVVSAPRPAPSAPAAAPVQRGLTDEDIASFKALRVEACIRSDEAGEIWLVPAYTGQARKELTPEHAATLARIVEAFPGARVVSFERQPKETTAA